MSQENPDDVGEKDAPDLVQASPFESEVELIRDTENLLVLGDSRAEVEGFLRAHGILERAKTFGADRLVPALRATAAVAQKMSDQAADSGLWVKLTPESAEAIEKYGLTDSGVPGIVHAMAGSRGSMKKWLQIDVRTSAKATNPVALSGLAGSLSQAAHEQDATELRALIEKLNYKLDLVLRGQEDDILGDLIGAESEIRAAMRLRELEGSIDATTWSKIAGASLQLRGVQAKAVQKLDGIASDLEAHKGIGELNEQLSQTEGHVRKWLSVIARCAASLDELTVLELTHYTATAPEQLNTRRISLTAARTEDQAALLEGVGRLVQRMDKAAENANHHKLGHTRGVPKALGSIEGAKSVVKTFYEGLGVEIDWTSIDPKQWFDAVREWRQWKNLGVEAGAMAWKKGKPVLGAIALTALTTLVSKATGGKSSRDPNAIGPTSSS